MPGLGVQAGDLMLMRDAQLDAIYGYMGCWVNLHYTVEAGARDIYGRAATETSATTKVRACVNPILRKAMEEVSIETAKMYYKQAGDFSLTFDLYVGYDPAHPDTYNTTKLSLNTLAQLWFDVLDESGASLIQLVPENKPPFAAQPRGGYYVEGRRYVQECFARPRT